MPKVVSVFGIEPFRIGGNETFARELSLQLGQQGWESVLCFLTPPPDDVRKFLSLPNVTLEILENSIGVNKAGALGLWRILRRHRPEIVHLHFINFLGLFPWIARFSFVKKVFITDHGSRPAGYIPRRAPLWKRTLVRLINLPLTKVTCVSNYGYRCFTALDLLPKDRFKMIYNSVDLTRVAPNAKLGTEFRMRFGIPADRKIVLQVSWIIPEKGIPDLLEAARLVVQQNDKVHFVLVGEGAFRQQYTEDAKRMGLEGHITWAGLIADPFGEGVYDAADIVCQVSNWEEVFGWVIAEAMAYMKPVIGTRVGGIPELVLDGETGFLVERSDSAAIADRIVRLATDEASRERMGHAARKITEEKFNLRKNVAQLVECYGLGNDR